jgi:hypothetical protein
VEVRPPVLKLRWVPATLTPKPIWWGLVPPVVSPGGVPFETVRE